MEKIFPSEPLVSCLCVTEGRPAFMPWLLWAYDRQTWPRRELVIVDSSPVPWQVEGRSDIRVIPAPVGSGVARKRNLALRAATGDCICWFDDDDWQHPKRIELLVAALRTGAAFAGAQSAWFVDLDSLYGEPYAGFKGRILFNSAIFRREIAQKVSFPETIRRASDTRWMSSLESAFPRTGYLIDRSDLFFWLCHTTNLSNPSKRHKFSAPLDLFKTMTGAESWGDTSTALDELKIRLKQTIPGHQLQHAPAQVRTMAAPPMTIAQVQLPKTDTRTPSVGVMIKATVLDTPYLETMVHHMLAQAHYPFAERIVIVDRRVDFSGKYRDRPRRDNASLDQALDRLVSDGIIDTVWDADMCPAKVKEINGRYFCEHTGRVPTHAITGGPIYATLFGMESLTTDYVLQMDCDVFFHGGTHSWVREALECLQADPSIWLMMSHPGPPAGPPGNSLGGNNRHRASWDAEHQVWRFKHATTRYFLCDRTRLRGKLTPIFQMGGCAPLEDCISLALKREGAARCALGNLRSWHLHAWYHDRPFPDWAENIAQLVEAGQYPEIQRGEYDLRLDQDVTRHAWAGLIHELRRKSGPGRTVPDSALAPPQVDQVPSHSMGEVPAQPIRRDTLHPANLSPGDPYAPISVIIPVRNRAGQHLRNTLASLNWQSTGRPIQVLVVNHGSQPNITQEIQSVCAEAGAKLLSIGNPSEPWNKPLALNTGIRNTAEEIPYIMTMDADMILSHNFLAVVLERLKRPPEALVLCRISDLPQQAVLPTDTHKLFSSFERLCHLASLRHRKGSGGIQAAKRSFFYHVHGYDEDLLWWGAMDGDMLIRARLMGLDLAWIESAATMLHQWHPRKYTILKNPREIEQARQHWIRNHDLVRQRAEQPVRNPFGWGGFTGDG